jgi:cell division protein FtsQ
MLILMLMIAGLIYATYRVIPDDTMPVRSVRVLGNLTQLNEADVRTAIESEIGKDFFSVDLIAIDQQVRALPWVHTVSVRRIWPETIEIKIVEQEVMALWGEDSVLNPYGEVFTPRGESLPEGLPVIFGADSRRHELIQYFIEIYESLAGIGLGLNSLIEDPRGSWSLGLNNGLSISLGQRDQMERVERFVRAYPGLIAARKDEVRRIDLRYSNGLAIAWNENEDDPEGREHRE